MAKKKSDLPLNPDIELFKWGPIPGRLFYPSDFVAPMFQELMDAYGECWPPSLFLFHGGRMCWINEYPIFKETGELIFKKHILPKKKRDKLYREWKQRAKTLSRLEDRIEKTNLAELSDKEFKKLWDAFYKRKSAFWLPSILPELGNYGSPVYLETQLIDAGVPRNDLSHVLEALTAPERSSFYREEEIALLETDDLEGHHRDYFWLQNSYNGTKLLPVSFFEDRKKQLTGDLRKEETTRQKEVIRRKKEVQKEFKLAPHIMDAAKAISVAVEWQDERKAYIFRSVHTKTLLLTEVARRLSRDQDELLNWPAFEVTKLLEGDVTSPWWTEGQTFYGIYQNERQSRVLTQDEAKQYWKVYVEGTLQSPLTEIRGVVASPGSGHKVRGTVKVLFDPHDLDSFKEGEILVTSMTSPEYVFAMKKAGAIITDTGGLTSHAAVTSRELGKPCIVGTKIATKVLQDGDTVEVDAVRGVIEVLHKA